MRYKESQEDNFRVTELGSSTSWSQTLNRNGSYTVEIYSIDANGQAGAKHIIKPSSQPTSLKSERTTTDNELSLSWDAPENNGNSEISGYVVEYRTGSGEWENSERERLETDKREVTLDKSISAKASRVRVSARTGVGLGSWAELDVSVKPDATVTPTPAPKIPTTDPTPMPVLNVNPDSYDFGTIQQGNTPSKEFTVRNTGGGTITWKVADNFTSDCFTVSPSPGRSQSGNGELTVTVKRNAKIGSCSDSFTVDAGDAGTKSIRIKVNVAELPVLNVSPSSHDFGNIQQGNTPSKEFTVTNAGGGTLTWEVDDNFTSDCFTVSPSPGRSQSGNGSLTVSLKSDAPIGSCSDNVTVDSVDAGTKSISITVNVVEGPAPVLNVSPSSHDFGNIQQGNAPSTEFTVTNAEGGTLTWQVDSNFTSDCFTVSPEPGRSQNGNGALTVTVKRDANIGSCSDSVIVDAGTAGTKSIRITVNVAEPPKLNVSLTDYDFGNIQQGNTSSKEFTVTNAGGGTITWEVDDNFTSDCFTVSPSPGSSQSGNGMITVTVKSDAPDGSCSDSFTVDAGNAGTKSITVKASIGQPPVLDVSPTDYDFGNIEQRNTPSKEFTVTNAGGGTLTWQVDNFTSDCFTVSPSPGSSQSGNGMITVTVKSDAPDGSCTDSVIVNAGNAGTKSIRITVNVAELPVLNVSPTDYDFGNIQQGNTPSKEFTVTNAGGGTLTWQVDDNFTSDCFTVSPSPGSSQSGNGMIIVTVKSDAPDGNCEDGVTVDAGDAGQENIKIIASIKIDRILFASNRDGNYKIYTMRADGTDLKRLTNNDADDYPEAWSPDGRRILFASQRDGNVEIYTMRADGTDVKRLTNNDKSDNPISWSPDGSRILFYTHPDGKDQEIYTMRADGTDVKRLTNSDAHDDPVDWSPDGRRILFASNRDGNSEIYTVRADGTDVKRLTDNDKYDSPISWSPDGSRILFTSTRDGNSEIYTMKPDGTDVQRLTNSEVSETPGTWSPDGSRILFQSSRDGNSEIYTMRADGTDVKRLTNNDADDFPYAWSPDGSRILFVSDRDGNREIYTIKVDGTDVKRLTNNDAYDSPAAPSPWSP